MLCHAAGCLRVLHGAGYVHRDVKPGNLMWMSRKKHWTLIGFACATAANSKAPLAYNVSYAAPEVLRAVLDGEETMRVCVLLSSSGRFSVWFCVLWTAVDM